ncbi:MAG: PIG-L family deacetylase [Candidatus Aminicenantes bacterium]|nr:PIG-L family deacetylase [Candidatus Aminicenantes bacterium]NIM83272.1 PIG-L family deacetylase [Candidatus Aminicenantes bacterium]NIN22643.1 PIG-L family deacetylase [Candidatus Aminicenantes bacterium]NIN46402.1 PIG-L family deacetylase [Candidatus Aminicenantes bacterium]NIN89252.1 PIG-L family deacetylase [Candidatus Aminicenantes bacterium]
MKILYIYPHPDDESFGPARAMAKQRRQGHEVYLLTLTKGGATKQRFKYGYSIEEMGDVRFNEMQCVAKTLDLSGMTVLDLPDSGLKEMDPREIENVIMDEIERIQPHVVVTYPVHGISGFHDHVVCHAVVKRVFIQLKEKYPWLKRLAFQTVTEEIAQQSPHFRLNSSTEEEIDCVFQVDAIDIEKNLDALDCYGTFQETIEKSGIKEFVKIKEIPFEIYQENYDPPLTDLFAGI